MIVACWWKLSLSNYCPSSACHCVLCSQHVLTLTPDTTALCRSARARHRAGRSPRSPLLGGSPAGERQGHVCGRSQKGGRNAILPWKPRPAARQKCVPPLYTVWSIPRSWLPRECFLQNFFGGPGMLLVVIGGEGAGTVWVL